MVLVACNPTVLYGNRIPGVFSRSLSSNKAFFSLRIGNNFQRFNRRTTNELCVLQVQAVASGLEDNGATYSQVEGASISTSIIKNSTEMKISVEVPGTQTGAIFDNVFSKMVADAQPIPGFRRVKGGKTPDIPQDVLLQVLGPSKVYNQVIKRIINVTVAEYVEKEGLKVGKDLRIDQSFEELEAKFEPGDSFSFDAVVHLLESN